MLTLLLLLVVLVVLGAFTAVPPLLLVAVFAVAIAALVGAGPRRPWGL